MDSFVTASEEITKSQNWRARRAKSSLLKFRMLEQTVSFRGGKRDKIILLIGEEQGLSTLFINLDGVIQDHGTVTECNIRYNLFFCQRQKGRGRIEGLTVVGD